MVLKKKVCCGLIMLILSALLLTGCKENTKAVDAGTEKTTATDTQKVQEAETPNGATAIKKVIYGADVSVSYHQDEKMAYYGQTTVADDFFAIINHLEVWQQAPNGDEPLGKSIPNEYLLFKNSDAIVIVSLCEKGTLLVLNQGHGPDGNATPDIYYLAPEQVYHDTMAVFQKYDAETLLELMKNDAHMANIEGVYYSKEASELRITNANLGNCKDLLQFTKMQTLRLSDVTIAKNNKLNQLTNLKYLQMNNVVLANLSFLTKLKNLEVITMTNINIGDISPFSALQKLDNIYLENMPIKDISPLADLKRLRGLVLSTMPVTDISPLKSLVNLETLEFKNMPFSDVSPLSGLKNLGSLSLTNTEVKDVSSLENMENLNVSMVP